MIKRIWALLLSCLLFFSSATTAVACDEKQTTTYVSQILFGKSSSRKASNENAQMLLSSLYLCSMQADGSGEEKVKYLKQRKVSGVSKLEKLDISGKMLLECSHNTWEHECVRVKRQQKNRKEVLQNTVNKICDFGFINNLVGSKKGKCNSFAALLYYSHILSDYLAAEPSETHVNIKGKEVPSYTGDAVVKLNGNKPSFTSKQKKSSESFIETSPLDSQKRAGLVFANIGTDILDAVGERERMVGIKPLGWNQKKYKGLVTSQPPYLYNRCHLLAHQLGGKEKENNLITGTRYLNEAMIPYENEVADYVKNTGNHVLYRATPIFKKDNKLASGIQLEAYSVEDSGKGICFNVYCYNVQPGVDINYMNGKNKKADYIFGKKNVLPFIAKNGSSNIIDEMNKHLAVLFEDQKNKKTYQKMMNEIKSVANKAHEIEYQEDSARYYIELKKYEYDYLEVLKSYVPRLLKKEKFFQSAFN
ncbi:DNA/RNA non-specific endonuclease [Blautia glucerasea]|uniref:DNA/RNA non-specific endonuclease n=1 Tax=Blautia glucerasea TaxID=536633 RepID=UPI001D07D08A|nr:DNA/RNA non-specific endonuclease [Blautia glucerasea]MCB6546034.1 DNA/RNA non-specific endonuclease [Blautia glucerasea]